MWCNCAVGIGASRLKGSRSLFTAFPSITYSLDKDILTTNLGCVISSLCIICLSFGVNVMVVDEISSTSKK